MLLSDSEIAALISEQKPLPSGFRQKLQVKPKTGHKERELDVIGPSGSEFRLILRQSDLNVLDFSIILAYQVPKTNVLFRLRRYNGKSHEHTNKIEKARFYDFHIHMATERYQNAGWREDGYAEPTTRYSDFHSAFECLLGDCALLLPSENEPGLFEGA